MSSDANLPWRNENGRFNTIFYFVENIDGFGALCQIMSEYNNIYLEKPRKLMNAAQMMNLGESGK